MGQSSLGSIGLNEGGINEVAGPDAMAFEIRMEPGR
jgi:hypothetical protein